MSDFRPAKKRVEVTVGESVKIIRELQGMSQNDLSKASGIVPTQLKRCKVMKYANTRRPKNGGIPRAMAK